MVPLTDTKCGCGKDGRYMHIVDGVEVIACNKYYPCPTYDELMETNNRLKSQVCKAIECARGLADFREGTDSYNDAISTYNTLRKEMGFDKE